MIKLKNKDISPRDKLNIQKISLEKSVLVNPVIEDDSNKILKEGELFRDLPAILLEYQRNFLKECYLKSVLVVEKSRRIGITHALACFAVLEACKENSATNFFYIGTNKELARDFISSCEYWAKAFNIASFEVCEVMIEDEKKDILAFRINFASGKRIEGLSSKPSSIRGRQGHIALDEFAFYESSQSEFLKSALALQIWGDKLFVISTHNGITNEFNILINQIINKEKPYTHIKITFQDALKCGLYERVKLIKKIDKDFKEWVDYIYSLHGENASEELDCIPREESSNSLFKRDYFKIIDRVPEYFDYVVWGWDFAATDKDNSCHTVGVKLGKLGDEFFILDWRHCKFNASQTQEFVIDVTKKSDKSIPIFLELEGGSQSILWLENSFKPLLVGYRVKGCRPEGSKMIRAIPIAEKAKSGSVYLVDSEWKNDFLSTISMFEGKPGVPLITDTGDALSLAFHEINKGFHGVINSGSVIKPKNRYNRNNNLISFR